MDASAVPPLENLQKMIGYRFRDPSLLQEALTHRSFSNEADGRDVRDNQRLEFFGDAVLDFLVSRELFARFPDKREGELTRMRAALVDETNLALLAAEIELGEFLLLGRGEERSGGRQKKSLLADAYEALLAAVFLDGGVRAASRLVARQFGPLLAEKVPLASSGDFKSAFQEAVQAEHGVTPRYLLISASGPDHARQFTVAALVGDEPFGEGRGRSKKEAEQAAAREGLARLRGTPRGAE